TEELPVKALPGLAQAFFDGVVAALEKRGVQVDAGEARPLYTPRRLAVLLPGVAAEQPEQHSEVLGPYVNIALDGEGRPTRALEKRGVQVDAGEARPLYTPRRLAVLLPGVAAEQPEQHSEVLGPYVNIALDGEGRPTRALEGFAAKAGVEWSALERTRDAKGERFVHRAVKPGARTAALLPEVLAEAIAAMPVPKPMRWGAHDYAFARPVHWLVLLLGDEVVPAQVLGVQAGRSSRGHRFEH